VHKVIDTQGAEQSKALKRCEHIIAHSDDIIGKTYVEMKERRSHGYTSLNAFGYLRLGIGDRQKYEYCNSGKPHAVDGLKDVTDIRGRSGNEEGL